MLFHFGDQVELVAGFLFKGIELAEEQVPQFPVCLRQQLFVGRQFLLSVIVVETVRIGFEQCPENVPVALDHIV